MHEFKIERLKDWRIERLNDWKIEKLKNWKIEGLADLATDLKNWQRFFGFIVSVNIKGVNIS